MMEHSKKHETISVVLSSITIIISIILILISITLYHQVKELYTTTIELEKSIKTLSTSSEKSESETIFILREYDGSIGIFDSAGVLIDVLDVQIKSLPEADRDMLRTGIYAFSRNELLSLIEDYTG